MREKRIVDPEKDYETVKRVPAEPYCGHDFCDACGDCLSCYEHDPCLRTDDGEHVWIEYLEGGAL